MQANDPTPMVLSAHLVSLDIEDNYTLRDPSDDGEPLFPLGVLSVSQTFQMSDRSFRQFMKILGDYRLPGDKPHIHKGKKP